MYKWLLKDGRAVILFTPEEFKEIPDGTPLLDVLGNGHIKGDGIEKDNDTRGGYLAYGLEVSGNFELN